MSTRAGFGEFEFRLQVAAVLVALLQAACAPAQLYRSDAFVLTDSSVVQGAFRAVARSRTAIESNYQRAAVEVNFKFSLNGFDNEHPPGADHMIYLRPRDGKLVTPIYRFGGLEPPVTPAPQLASASPEEGPVDVTFRLDLRHVLDSLRVRGAYRPPNGEPIARGELSGVYVVGNVTPLSWDFGRLVPGAPVELHDGDGDGIYEVTLRFDAAFRRPLAPDGTVRWRLQRDLSRFPAMTSPQRLVDALHNLALEELRELERADGTLDAGGRWPGVWTRDLAWSALLGLALAAPDAVRAGLLTRVDSLGRIIQDSGSGGSWPISTDRVAWALAAWELYAVTGDREWLRWAYDIIRRSSEADLVVVHDSANGLFRGESSFLDWRDQSYPRWMDPKDIGHAEALGTNVLHFATYRVLGRMARLLGEPPERWDRITEGVRTGLDDQLWSEPHGYYGQFRYGRIARSVSPRAEHLGEALAVVFGAADRERAARMLQHVPVVPFGVPSFWPYIPGVPPYHNAGVWPQVVGFHAWAAADAGNAAAVEHALANLFRAAGLFLTNKENWVATTGHFEGTEVNSDRFNASAAAQLAASYRVLFGIRLEPDRLRLQPFVPRAYAGTRSLRNLRYREATLTLTVHGFGASPREVRLDGVVVPRAEVPASLTGRHTLEVTLDGVLPPSGITLGPNNAAPATPHVRTEGPRLVWDTVAGAARYQVVRNGEPVAETAGMSWPADEPIGVAEYQVQALNSGGIASFLSEPVRIGPAAATQQLDARGATLDRSSPPVVLAVTVPAAGWYAIDASYANGNGPVSYGYRAAARALHVDGRRAGTLLMPQRGAQRWTYYGYTNPVRVRLDAGRHELSVEYDAPYRNMDGVEDRAVLQHLRIARLAPDPRERSPRDERMP